MSNRLLVVPNSIVRLPDLAVHGCALQRRQLPAGHLHEHRLRLPVVLQRLGVGGDAAGLIAGGEQRGVSVLPVLGAGIVIGEQAHEFVAVICKQALDSLSHATVDRAAALGKEAAVGRLLHQRMLEDVFDLRDLLAQPDQLGVLKPADALLHVVGGLTDRLQDAQEEAAPDDGRRT